MVQIKVLGSGCPNCQKLEREARAALDSPGIEYELTKVTSYEDIARYGVMQTPALVINEKVVSSGKIPKREQILTWVINTEER